MARVELSWEEPDGTSHPPVSARMEDTSLSGACIRANKSISVGSKIWVKRRSEEFAGIAKYCRKDGTEFVLGIQRVRAGQERNLPLAPYSPQGTANGLAPARADAKVVSNRAVENRKATQIDDEMPAPPSGAVPKGNVPRTHSVSSREASARGTGSTDRPRMSAIDILADRRSVFQSQKASYGGKESISGVPQKSPTPWSLTVAKAPSALSPAAAPAPTPISIQREAAPEETRRQKKNLPMQPCQGVASAKRKSSTDTERRHMSTKWLGMAFNRQKQDAPTEKSESELAVNDSDSEMEDAPFEAHHNGPNRAVRLQGNLQSAEDIYRAAGIMSPRMGYSITKVVEMINSDHMRGLPNEAKRAAVFMALDAANISVEEVLRDATLRQEALSGYEAAQQKSFEEYWALKAEGNAQIQAELDRMVAQSLERIRLNLDEVAREKVEFAKWQDVKRKEVERMAEAVVLCSKQTISEPASVGSALALSASGSTVKPS